VSNQQPLERRVFRRNLHRFVLPLLYLVPSFIFGLFAIQTTPILWIGVAICAWLAYRTVRIGVFTSDRGVVVRNVLRSRRLEWAEIARFDWGSSGGFPSGGAYRVDGTFVRAFALNPPFEAVRGQNKAVPKALEGLNRELEQSRAATVSSTRVDPTQQTTPAAGEATALDQLTLE
jgi:hypothetical protein